MKIMYRVKKAAWGEPIEALGVIRETDKSVFLEVDSVLKERREAKWSEAHQWFDDFDDAKACSMAYCEREVNNARRRLELAKGRFGNAKGFKKPTK